jgi:nicotinamide riboside transporter PnuC
MALDYFILVFISSLGVYQITAIHAKLDGLCFFKNRVLQFIFGLLAIIGAFVWFYTSQDRNIHTKVEGSQQLGLFLASIVASYLFTAIMASIMQAKVTSKEGFPREGKQYDMGMETLKKTTLFGGIMSSLRRERKDKV